MDSLNGPVRDLYHGNISHGSQFLRPDLQRHPTAYYSPASGIGAILSRPHPARRVGVIGLGADTLAAYSEPGDIYRFYEVNPLVVEIARSRFTFLAGSRAQIEVVLGDARLALKQEKPRATMCWLWAHSPATPFPFTC